MRICATLTRCRSTSGALAAAFLLQVLPGAATPRQQVNFTILAWQKRYWHFAGRLHCTLVVFATIGLLLWLDYWNLIGSRD